MKYVRLALKLLLLTAAAVLAVYWALGSITVDTPLPTNLTTAEIVRERFPFRLIQPEWVTGGSQFDIFNWSGAEIKTRFALITILWYSGAILIVHYHLRRASKA